MVKSPANEASPVIAAPPLAFRKPLIVASLSITRPPPVSPEALMKRSPPFMDTSPAKVLSPVTDAPPDETVKPVPIVAAFVTFKPPSPVREVLPVQVKLPLRRIAPLKVVLPVILTSPMSFGVPSRLPVTFPVRLPVTFPANLPTKPVSAVICPAEKLPDASRFTKVLGVLAEEDLRVEKASADIAADVTEPGASLSAVIQPLAKFSLVIVLTSRRVLSIARGAMFSLRTALIPMLGLRRGLEGVARIWFSALTSPSFAWPVVWVFTMCSASSRLALSSSVVTVWSLLYRCSKSVLRCLGMDSFFCSIR